MRSFILRLVLALAALTVVPNALAADGGDIFLDAKVGKTYGGPGTYQAGYSSQTQSSWGADGGYLWKFDEQRSAGFELGYQHFGKVSDFAGNSGSDQLSASAMTLGAISFILDINGVWRLDAM